MEPVGSGTIDAPTQSCTGGYLDGTVVQLTAVPGTGYAFENWSGAASGTSNPVSVTMDGSKSVHSQYAWEHAHRTFRHADQLEQHIQLDRPERRHLVLDGNADLRWHADLPQVVYQRTDGLLGRHGLFGGPA